MKKRRLMLYSIISLIMVFVMAVPMTVSADTATEVTSKDELVNALSNGATSIKLTKDIVASITIDNGKNVTIDLNGKTLTGDKDHTITNAGVLTVVDSSNGGKIVNNDRGKGTLFNKPGATATLKGGTFTGTTWYVIKNLGSLTIQAGTTVTQKDAGSSSIDNGWYNAANPNEGNDCNTPHSKSQTAGLVIAGGEFSGGMNTIKNDDYGILKISGGTFSNTDGPTVLNWNVAEISGGSFTVNNVAKAVLTNGGYGNEADQGNLTVTGGKFTASIDGKGALLGYGRGATGGSVSIKDGTFNGSLAITQDYPYTPEISGGEFTDDPAQYVAEGKVAIKFVRANKDGNYYVGTQEEIQEIANTAKDGDTIDVIKGSITLNMTTPGVNVNNDRSNEKGEVIVNGTPLNPGYGMEIQKPATDPTKPSQDQTQKPSDTAKADKSAKTGDDFNLFAVGGVALAAIIAMAAVAITGRRHRQR